MELDHTVVLFDEIDELVRERKDSADAFGRFLTTSMLPKLAFLWKIRKVIYFVNTNYLEYFDTAITRDERFDALIFVPPPSFKKKMARICEIINATIEPGTDLSVAITEEEIWGATPVSRGGELRGAARVIRSASKVCSYSVEPVARVGEPHRRKPSGREFPTNRQNGTRGRAWKIF
jgi:SpoVK/Ycf46/Vps4 family AAA+-type ATPase